MAKFDSSWARGIDVSNHNGPIDWERVAQSGVTFAFMKATEGATWHDPTFEANVKGAKAAGLLVGAYCFARFSSSSPEDEADALVNAVEAVGGVDLPLVLDLEDDGGLSPEALTDATRRWLARIISRTGRIPVLYVSPAFARNKLRCADLPPVPLWVAHYGVDAPDVPPPWPRWSMWQYTSEGSVSGIEGRVDLDVFNGDVDDLRRWAGLTQREATRTPKGGDDMTSRDLPVLRQGAHGNAVKAVQAVVGTKVDGIFGPDTEAAVRRWQGAHKLAVDGVVGPQTWASILQS